ncbi:hypothetical protein SAMN05443253_1244 [Bacillus sp. OK048]|nr:hypothetical protein SAMN05443253_1244 [Bacillus sp. OK048]
MGYCEDIREMIGDSPLIIVRPSVAIINDKEEILLSKRRWNLDYSRWHFTVK